MDDNLLGAEQLNERFGKALEAIRVIRDRAHARPALSRGEGLEVDVEVVLRIFPDDSRPIKLGASIGREGEDEGNEGFDSGTEGVGIYSSHSIEFSEEIYNSVAFA